MDFSLAPERITINLGEKANVLSYVHDDTHTHTHTYIDIYIDKFADRNHRRR